jgi:predicted transcriptional regulator
MSVTIRIPAETHERLRALATARQQPIGQVVTVAVEHLEAERFWDELEAAYEQLYADPAAAAEYEAETAAWDATLLDGLETDPWVE